jgi:fructose-bisphosphate aldolase class 1
MSKQGIVNIRGKEYKTVALRVQEFREQFKDYALTTDVIQLDQDQCVIKATVLNELNRVVATGLAQEFRKASQINGTSYVENCETSAIGRALACLGLGGQEFASANEVLNAIHQQNNPPVENITDDDVEVAKGQLVLAKEAGELKERFFKFSPQMQERLREFANELKKAA